MREGEREEKRKERKKAKRKRESSCKAGSSAPILCLRKSALRRCTLTTISARGLPEEREGERKRGTALTCAAVAAAAADRIATILAAPVYTSYSFHQGSFSIMVILR